MNYYCYKTKVAKVENKKQIVSGSVVDGKTVLVEEDLGWFILFEGSREAIRIGAEEPPIKKGRGFTVLLIPDDLPPEPEEKK